jgi:FkbM family methyltransferase
MSNLFEAVAMLGGELHGLVHVGANIGQEFEAYRGAGLCPVVYVEPHPEVFARLRARVSAEPGHIAINALCGERDGELVPFHVSSNDSNSSSMLDFGWHSREHPEVTWVDRLDLATTRLDTLLDRCAADHAEYDWTALDCLVLDTQGAELIVLSGAERTLRRITYVYTEVNEGGLYEGDCSLDELIQFMHARDFRIKNLAMNSHGWGDALFAITLPRRRSRASLETAAVI